ncbi:DUF4279 domain-containing protein [Shewanella psychromarinicola]|uniref:DUF4279 domain-containing protein n=1 Tax=Shewanella psychromarinicola TaxID=2487742 RepID=A0A3N4DJG0_9GAMM|nr:DUF4279 domain-containing protein [Shewanella psychromarinicola]AZG33657.1 DUF4279 domain-containing protein [Shewanella psychromarinicola]MCL1084475.1 DUF4279 domain-containing protein [Shewanella psychromarinicola]RPA22391.1 DUF4279 domain-containing protein [Shewanella psychromarinicola]
MACTETYSTLLIFSEDITPDEINKSLGFFAHDIWVKDPEHKYKHRRERNIWKWTTQDLCKTTDNIEHLNIILKKLEGKESVLENLRNKGCETKITNFWDSTGQGGPSLTVELMRRLSVLGLDILWDMYFDDESET